MTSIERTAYPRVGRLVSARELTGLSPSADEVLWARNLARSDAHLLALIRSTTPTVQPGWPWPNSVPVLIAPAISLRRWA